MQATNNQSKKDNLKRPRNAFKEKDTAKDIEDKED